LSREPALDRAQRRREIAWFVGAVLAVAALLFSARWWAALLDHVDPVTATAIFVVVGGALLASRGRRGLGWNVLRVLCVAGVALALALATLVAVCIPSACFN